MHPLRSLLPILCLMLALSGSSPLLAQISLSITVGPPPIPFYEQPECPADGYTWTPGYWAWGEDGYYWVPGTWVRIPEIGLFWTPGYWGWNGHRFTFRSGYWATEVGFYGGINYGHGYGGSGYDGGHWRGRDYYYNRSVTRVNSNRITHVYDKRVHVDDGNRVAFNGGRGGIRAAPSEHERERSRGRRVAPTAEQEHHRQGAAQIRDSFVSMNQGRPPVAATVKPADFSPGSAMPARAPGGTVEERTLRASPRNLVHGKDRSPGLKPSGPKRPDPQAKPAPNPRPTPRARPSSPNENRQERRH